MELDNCNQMTSKHHHSVKKMQTPSVAKRNLRERTRVKGVNYGFGKLKKHVPDLRSKSSKVETIRGAIEYIKKLRELLGEEADNNSTGSSGFGGNDIIISLFYFINYNYFFLQMTHHSQTSLAHQPHLSALTRL